MVHLLEDSNLFKPCDAALQTHLHYNPSADTCWEICLLCAAQSAPVGVEGRKKSDKSVFFLLMHEAL